MSENNTMCGWNKPKQEQDAMHDVPNQKRGILRGVLAGLCVAMLTGAMVWFLVGQEPGKPRRRVSSTSKLIKSVKPTRVNLIDESEKPAKEPSLPIPKISKERIDKRDDIPAPQPLEEMQAALTNTPPKKKVAFSNGAEQLIAMATPSTPGAHVPPLPYITDESVAGEVEKAMKNVIRAEDGDSDDVLEKKMVVAQAKEEFNELRNKEGWGFTEYVNTLRDQANDNANFLGEAHKMADEIYHDASISNEDYIKYREQINAKLRERGLPEIDSEEE